MKKVNINDKSMFYSQLHKPSCLIVYFTKETQIYIENTSQSIYRSVNHQNTSQSIYRLVNHQNTIYR